MGRTFDATTDSVVELPPFSMVNASAGTGKTWTVTHLASRWLIEVEGRSPAAVLMVTFAREAAGELKGRLRGRLEEIVKELQNPASKEEWAIHLHVVAAEQGRDTILARCARVLHELDDLNARTIHSFAAVVQGTPEGFIGNVRRLRSQAAREAVTWAAIARPDELVALVSDIKTDGNPANRLVEQIQRALEIGLPLGGFGGDGLITFNGLPNGEDPTFSKLDLFRELIEEAARREKKLREIARGTTFDAVIGDLLLEVRRQPDAVRRRVGGQFQLVIIDEFQDTDSGQWEIFSEIFMKGPNSAPVLVVGDAKQSIYSFRGGDVTIMQQRQGDIEDSDLFAQATLEKNFRSHSGLLEHLNSFFQPEGMAHTFIPEGNGPAIKYEEVSSPDTLNDGSGVFTIRDIRGINYPEGANAAIRRDLIAEIRRLTNANSQCHNRELPNSDPNERWKLSDIVILCRGKTFIRELQRDLDRSDIPYVTPRTLSVFSTIAAAEVRLLLWALEKPEDQRRWRSLSSSWFSALIESRRSPLELVSLLHRYGVSALHREVTSGTYLANLLSYKGGQRHVTDIEHIFNAIALEFPHGSNVSEILLWLEDAIVASDLNDDSVDGQRRIESDENAVRLMTIHASKGLEFPVVLIPDPETMGKDPLIVSRHTDIGKSIDLRSVLLEAKDRKGAMADEVTQENDRLLYVALTRATNVLTAWVTDEHDKVKTPAWFNLATPWLDDLDGEPASSQVDDGNADASAHALIADTPRVVRISKSTLLSYPDTRFTQNSAHVADVDILPIGRSISEPNHRWSYSTLHVAGSSQDDSEVDHRSGAEDPTTEQQVTSKGRRGYKTFGDLRGNNLGDAVHGVFEHVVGRVSADNTEELQRIIAREFGEQGLSAPDSTLPTIQRLLRHSLGSPWHGGCLNDYANSELLVASEMRFTLPLSPRASSPQDDLLVQVCGLVSEHDADGPFTDHFRHLARTQTPGRLLQGFLTGSIDLVAPTLGDERRYVLLDYKSNSLTVTSDFSAASLAIEMAASGYPLQALLYSVALHRHLTVRMGDSYEAETHLGGATYYYVRGAGLADAAPGEGVFHWAIPPVLTKKVSALFRGEK